ncbi:MAG: type II toxin-antitoxin system RelE/ParE family toxin [Pyrinomonadaceae bacterium]
MKARFHPEARAEHLQSARFYERERKGLDTIARAVKRIGKSPDSFPVYRSPFRRLVILEFPFTLIYSIEADSVLIVAVAHQSREPEYWTDRLS